MTEQFAWTFPAGKKKILKATGTAGDTATVITVPTGKRWLLTNIRITLTTDATVVNRYCSVLTRDTDDDEIFACAANATPASTTATKYFVHGLNASVAAYNSLGYNLLDPTEDVVLDITAGVAGDSYDYLVECLEIDIP